MGGSKPIGTTVRGRRSEDEEGERPRGVVLTTTATRQHCLRTARSRAARSSAASSGGGGTASGCAACAVVHAAHKKPKPVSD